MAARRVKFWGWGYEDDRLAPEDERRAVGHVLARTGLEAREPVAPPRLEEIELPPPRLAAPPSLAPIVTTEGYERALHSYGKSYPDYVRAFRRDYTSPPDVVAYPESEADVRSLLDWAGSEGAAVIPFGAGSSVVGGIEPAVGDRFRAVVTIDMRRMGRVLEVDKRARAARIEAGVLGPALEDQLRPHGLTLRHFPQSFAFSTLGGWIATRSGGHFATLYTHIDDFVESLTVLTPAGRVETRRLPGSGAGPQPERLFIGSEGALGLITEAWMRVQDRPGHRASAALLFGDFRRGAEAVRAIAQTGLNPANCRLIDAEEAALAGAADGRDSVLVLGFESADHAVEHSMARALECARDHGGRPAGAGDPARRWRDAFIAAPILRESLIARGLMHDTFETAITWDRFEEFHARVRAATERAIREATGRAGHVTCRFTHCYPDGVAPYFTYHAMPARGREIEQWRLIKGAASDAIIAGGGTITHHHAVGRDHMAWYERERPALFGSALEWAKKLMDPRGIMNPGVLVGAR